MSGLPVVGSRGLKRDHCAPREFTKPPLLAFPKLHYRHRWNNGGPSNGGPPNYDRPILIDRYESCAIIYNVCYNGVETAVYLPPVNGMIAPRLRTNRRDALKLDGRYNAWDTWPVIRCHLAIA